MPNFAPLFATGALVQLVRMPACHAGGRWFESCTHRKWREEKSEDVLRHYSLFLSFYNHIKNSCATWNFHSWWRNLFYIHLLSYQSMISNPV